MTKIWTAPFAALSAAKIAALSLAVLAVIGSAIYFSGIFERDINVTFAAEAELQMPKILLLPAESNECQRRRVLDGAGGAVDNVDLTDGSTRVVEFKKLPNISREVTYYPAPAGGFKNCDSFAQLSARGPLLSEIERDATGLKPVRERRYAINGTLTSQGNLIADGSKFQTDYLAATGLITRSETYNLVSKAIESETLYRDGIAYLRQALKPTESNFVKEHFSPDGKVVAWKESRSYGIYAITRMYPNGTPHTEATRGINYTILREYRPDGTSERVTENWQYSTDVTLYNAAGKPKLETKWKTDSKANLDPSGKPQRYLAFIVEVNEEGRALRRFEFRKDGTLETVTVHKEAQLYKDRVEYNFDATGKRVVSIKPFDAKGDVMPLVTYTSDPGIKFDVDKALFEVPNPRLPDGLFDHDDRVSTEIPHGRGGM
jgi:hypothetical protein